mgnify:CR=1 FL=1
MFVQNNVSVAVRNVSKTYNVPIRKMSNRLELLAVRRRTVHAVKNVSFIAKEGESIGILGRNGSGKSTLLRMIAGNESPTSGEIFVSDQPSLLGVSAALQPNLTGYQNIELGLLAIGKKAKDLRPVVEEVAKLSRLEEALERPMVTYSSGMQARLTFAIATSLEPKILMIDEALGTGDATFAETARIRMDELRDRSGTVFVVSHSAATLRKSCERALWIHDGEIIADGKISDVSKDYAIWGEKATYGTKEEAQAEVDRVKSEYCPPNILFASEVDNRS